MLGQLDDGIARNSAENRTQKRRRNQCVLELEEHVHRADFLDILVLLAIEPKHLLIALLLRDIARKNRRRVVAARFRETDAALHRANQFRLHINTDWRKTLGIIRAGRRTNNEEAIRVGRMNA